ncbi:hypothetical protein [Rhizobium sp. PL01]|uniref:hypothetical protein n=1 Tax=Rhizobium sp. PL01 TaxID=3085631 RepID=UPI0029812763|nr:hypothetical protein [Rhizobium sp. PL01]MDW5312980.1 hypothetical protein [Rhizobium sp. PL01]
MVIVGPTHSPDEPEYEFECQRALELEVLDLVDKAGQAGWETGAAFRALAEIVVNQALAYEQDPAEDAVGTEDGRYLSAEKLVASFVSGRDVPDA